MSPEAQFTPKQVETRSERDKLMFRVKIQVPEGDWSSPYIERIKTGVRGVGYVKVDDSAVWPAWLRERSWQPRVGGGVNPPRASRIKATAAQDDDSMRKPHR